MAHQCENCKFRAHYDKKPNSLMGRFWRWHINFCPGWKAYFTSLPADQQRALRETYQFTNINNSLKQKHYGKRVFSVYR